MTEPIVKAKIGNYRRHLMVRTALGRTQDGQSLARFDGRVVVDLVFHRRPNGGPDRECGDAE